MMLAKECPVVEDGVQESCFEEAFVISYVCHADVVQQDMTVFWHLVQADGCLAFCEALWYGKYELLVHPASLCAVYAAAQGFAAIDFPLVIREVDHQHCAASEIASRQCDEANAVLLAWFHFFPTVGIAVLGGLCHSIYLKRAAAVLPCLCHKFGPFAERALHGGLVKQLECRESTH